jgi:plasmid stability protein
MATITLKNVPDDLYRRLKEEAARNRRSLNQEVINRLAAASLPPQETSEQILARLRRFRATLPRSYNVSLEEIDRWKREGRE